MAFEPSEDIPCIIFKIHEGNDDKGFGLLSIGYEYEINGQAYGYECHDSFKIVNLEIFNNGEELLFSLVEIGHDNNDWKLRYNLNKIE